MSWVGGEFILNDIKKKDLDAIANRIRYVVRSNANLAEFPNMGNRINPFKHICPQKIFNSYEEAENALEDRRSEWSRNYTGYVAFRDIDSVKESKQLMELKKKIDTEREKEIRYGLDNNVKDQKADYIGCRKCGSKINKSYIQANRCPVCDFDLRSDTFKKRMAGYQEKIDKLMKELNEEKKKNAAKAPVKYLVMYEEYVG